MNITEGRYTATVRINNGGYFALVTRNGSCLHGIAGRHYATEKAAIVGARKMLAKAAA